MTFTIKNQINRFPLLLMIILLVAFPWPFLDQGYSDEKNSVQATQEKTSTEIDPAQLESRLKEIRETLKIVEAQENEQTAQQLGTTIAELQKRNTIFRTLESIYQRLLTTLTRRDSLKKEEETLRKTLESEQEGMIKDPPPYSLGIYENYLDRVTVAEQEEQNANSTVKFIKKEFEDAKAKYAQTGQRLRNIKEKLESEKDKKTLLLLNWDYEIARAEEELAKTTLDLQKIARENAEIEIDLARLKKKVAQRDTDWIRAHLVYDEEELNKRLSKIEEKRKELKERISILIQEKNEVENKWLEAQREVEAVRSADDEVKKKAKSFLKAREAWRETYQRVLEQSEIMIQILNLEDQLWLRRYALLRTDIDLTELDLWRGEAESFVKRVDSGMRVVQMHQNNLQSQITTVEKQLAEEGIDPVIKQNGETQLNALRKSSERNLEFQSTALGMRELQQRLISEIDARQTKIPVKDKLKGLGSKIVELWEFELWVINERSVTIKKVVIALFIFIIGMVLARLVTRALGNRLSSATRFDKTAASAIEKVVYYFALLFLVLFALRTVNIPLTVFTFLGGAIAIGVGFGAQNLINNFISGFILMVERPVKIGDLIEVENKSGIIEAIGTRCTRIRTAGNIHILVPNSSFLEKNIINWTLADKEIRTQITVGVAYGSDTRNVRKLILKAAGEHGKVLKNPEPLVLFNEFGDNALIFELYFWIQIKRIMDRRMIESDIRFIIDELFREAGIVIAFPQRDVHLDTLKPLDVRVLNQKAESDEE